MPRICVSELEPGKRFRLLAARQDDDGGTIDQITRLVALEVVQDGPWIRVRLEDGRTVSLDRDDTVAVEG